MQPITICDDQFLSSVALRRVYQEGVLPEHDTAASERVCRAEIARQSPDFTGAIAVAGRDRLRSNVQVTRPQVMRPTLAIASTAAAADLIATARRGIHSQIIHITSYEN